MGYSPPSAPAEGDCLVQDCDPVVEPFCTGVAAKPHVSNRPAGGPLLVCGTAQEEGAEFRRAVESVAPVLAGRMVGLALQLTPGVWGPVSGENATASPEAQRVGTDTYNRMQGHK